MSKEGIFRVLPGNRWVEVTPSPSGGFTADVHLGQHCVGMTGFKTTEAALLWAATQHPKQEKEQKHE